MAGLRTIHAVSPPGQKEPPNILLKTPRSRSVPVAADCSGFGRGMPSSVSLINLPRAHWPRINNCVSVSRRNLEGTVLESGLSPHKNGIRIGRYFGVAGSKE